MIKTNYQWDDRARLFSYSMKIIQWCLWVGIFLSLPGALIYSQRNDSLMVRLPDDGQPMPLNRFVHELERQSGVFFVYSSSTLDMDQWVDPGKGILSFRACLDTLKNQLDLTMIRQPGRIVLLQNILSNQNAKGTISLSGFVKDGLTLEVLSGANIVFPDWNTGTISDDKGFFRFRCPKDRFDSLKVKFSFVGYQELDLKLPVNKSFHSDILLYPDARFDEVIIVGVSAIQSPSEGTTKSPSGPFSAFLPGTFGTGDLFRGVALLPGVFRGNDLQSGLSVRGLGPGANHYLIDGLPIYEPNHAFGLVSVVHGDMIRQVNLYKQQIPLTYSGRTGAVLNHLLKSGNGRKREQQIGISPIALQGGLEGPLLEGNTSYILKARKSILDSYLPKLISDFTDYHQVSVDFWDASGKLTHQINPVSTLEIMGFLTQDDISFNLSGNHGETENQFSWSNRLLGISYKTFSSRQFFHKFQAGWSRYESLKTTEIIQEIPGSEDRVYYNLSTRALVNDLSFSHTLDWYAFNEFDLSLGSKLLRHIIRPSQYRRVAGIQVGSEEVLESPEDSVSWDAGLFISVNWKVGEHIQINAGSGLNAFFPGYKKPFLYLDPSICLEYKPGRNHNYSLHIQRLHQNVHLIQTRSIGISSDLWLPANAFLPPESVWQFALEHRFVSTGGFRIESDLYYRKLDDQIDYRSPADLYDPAWGSGQVIPVFSDAGLWEDRVIRLAGSSFGLETAVSFHHEGMAISLSYAYGKTVFHLKDDPASSDFPGNFDFTHGLHLFGQYSFNPGFQLFLSWEYQSGQVFSLPQHGYLLPGDGPIISFSERNNARMPAYHSLRTGGSFKMDLDKVRWEVDFGFSNLYNRANPLFVFIDQDNTQFQIRQVNGFPILPYVNLKFNF